MGFCHPGNQSCCQSALLPSLLNPPESLRHICLAEILSGWSCDGNNTSQPCDKPMLPVDIQRHGSSRKCFKSPWQHFIVSQTCSPPACFPQELQQIQFVGQNQRGCEQQNWHNLSPVEGLAFSLCQWHRQASCSLAETQQHTLASKGFRLCAARERGKEDGVTPRSCLLQLTARRADSVRSSCSPST